MIAIVYHYIAHYRYPIFSELCKSPEFQFIIISGTELDYEIKTVDPKYANISVEEGGLRWEFVKNIWLFNKRLLWQKGLIKKCLTNKFEACIFLGDVHFITTWISAIILRIKGKKVYFWTHGVYEEEKGLKNYFRLKFYKLADGLFLYGNYAAKMIEKKGIENNKLHVIYNSLDYEAHLKLRDSISEEVLKKKKAEYFPDPSLPQLIFIGRLTRQKKVHQIIEAVKELRDEHLRLNVLLVGDGEEEVRIKELVRRYDLGKNVFFFGPSYNEFDNFILIAGSDISVSPGDVGLTAIHSLSCGTPVITHNNFIQQMPEFEAIIPGYNGDFYEMDNIHALSTVIKNWLKVNTNREKIRTNCYNIIDEKYNPDYQLKTIINVLKNDKVSQN